MAPRFLLAGALLAGPAPVVDVGSRLELFVDDRVIDSTTAIEFRQHEPRPAGLALVFDRPWEGNSSGHGTIFREQSFRKLRDAGSTHVQRLRFPNSERAVIEGQRHDGVTE